MEKVIPLPDWPAAADAAELRVHADEHRLILQYDLRDDGVAVITFPTLDQLQFGSPNDEALNGHRLWKKGLKPYRVYCVKDSVWIRELEKRNSVLTLEPGKH